MNDILLTINFDDDAYLCPSVIHALNNQTLSSEIVCLFSKSEQKDIYKNYFYQYNYSNLNYLYNQNNNILLKTIYEEYLSKYTWFAFISPYILYHKNFAEELSTNCVKYKDHKQIVVVPQNNTHSSFKNLVYHRDSIIDNIKHKSSLRDIIQSNNKLENIKSIISFASVSWKDMEYEYLSKQNSFHNDSYCVFAKFVSGSGSKLQDSFVYINKKNYRAYSISNNMIGQVDDYGHDKITISWQLDYLNDDKKEQNNYYFDHYFKCYNQI